MQASLQPMATVAHWTKAQLAGPKWRPLDGACHQMHDRARSAHDYRTVHVQRTRRGAVLSGASMAKC
jgi:hypothetical protein